MIIGGLVHAHPLKGTGDFIAICKALEAKYGPQVLLTGIGEAPLGDKPSWFTYHQNLSRDAMAQYMKQIDIWIGCSHSEGLGRMALEAMSSSVACVLSDTGAEFVKHRKNALTFPVGDAQKGAERVVQVMENTDLFSGLLANGYETAERASDPTEFIERIEKVIKRLTNE